MIEEISNQDDRGNWVVTAPSHCPNGHPLGPGLMLVGNRRCPCSGHLTWTCRQCWCSIYNPPLQPGCTPLHGPAEVTW